MEEVKITGEEVFRAWRRSILIGPAAHAYQIKISADGTTFESFGQEVSASEHCAVTDIPPGTYLKLVGNTGEVTIQR